MTVLGKAVLSGRAHVFTYANDAYLEAVRRLVVGMPLREVFPEEEYRPFLHLFDWAREHQASLAWVVTAPNGYVGLASLRPLGPDLLHEWEPLRAARPAVDRESLLVSG